MSRFNTMVGAAKSQYIPADAKLELYTENPNTGIIDLSTKKEISDKTILSNTVLAFSGGE